MEPVDAKVLNEVLKGERQDLPLALLDDAADNPNSMEPEQFAMLAEAIRRVGFLQPALVRARDEGRYEIIDGHHRVRAARELKFSEVPCVVVRCDDRTTVALRVGMNRLRGELNLSAVAKSLDDLVANGWQMGDLTITGFSADEVGDLLQSLKLNEDDVLGQQVEVAGDDDHEEVRAFVLEVSFTDRDDFKRAKAGLKRAAGKSGDLGRGLLRLLGE